jgi:hypothetical protein
MPPPVPLHDFRGDFRRDFRPYYRTYNRPYYRGGYYPRYGRYDGWRPSVYVLSKQVDKNEKMNYLPITIVGVVAVVALVVALQNSKK